jgi:hypothetical protein
LVKGHLSACAYSLILAPIDAWAAAQDEEPGRSEAIRRLVGLGLKVKSK